MTLLQFCARSVMNLHIIFVSAIIKCHLQQISTEDNEVCKAADTEGMFALKPSQHQFSCFNLEVCRKMFTQ